MCPEFYLVPTETGHVTLASPSSKRRGGLCCHPSLCPSPALLLAFTAAVLSRTVGRTSTTARCWYAHPLSACAPARALPRLSACRSAGAPAFRGPLAAPGRGGQVGRHGPAAAAATGSGRVFARGGGGGDGGGGAAAAASACPSGRCCFRGRLFVGVFCVFLVMEGGRWGLSLPLCCWVGGGGDGRGVGMTSGDGWRRGGGRRVYSRGCPTPQFDGGLSGTASAEGFFFCLL